MKKKQENQTKSEKKHQKYKIPYPVATVLADNSQNWKTILASIIGFLIESAIFYYYLHEKLALAWLIIVHCLVLALLGLLTFTSCKNKEDIRYPVILFLATLAMGPLGIAGMFVFMLLRPLFSLVAAPFTKWYHDLFPEHGNIFTNVFQRIRAGWDDYSKPVEITPFLDFFSYGSLPQKQAVLDRVVAHYKPEYTPILRSALKDPSNVIRIQAAAIEAKLEHDFEITVREIERQQDPHKPETALLLAQHYDYYSYLDIFNPIREQENQKKAIGYYRSYLEKKGDDQSAHTALGRLLARHKDYPAVIKWFEELQKKFKEFDIHAYPWYLEALYHQKKYETLSVEANRILPELKRAEFPKEIIDNVETWGGIQNDRQ